MSLGTRLYCTHLEEVVKANSVCLWPVHLLLMFEEEPCCDAHVKQICVVPMKFHKVQSHLVAVSATEKCPGFPLSPWNAPCSLGC